MNHPAAANYQPLLRATVAIACGMVVDRYLAVPLLLWLSGFGVCAVAWLVAYRRNQIRLASAELLLCVAATAGLWHNLHWNWYGLREIGTYAQPEPVPVMLRGHIISQPERLATDPLQKKYSRIRKDRTRVGIQVSGIRRRNHFHPASGNLTVYVDGPVTGLAGGDEIVCSGKLSAIGSQGNPGEFDFQGFFRGRRTLCRMNVKHPACLRKTAGGNPFRRLMSGFRSTLDGWIWKYLSADYAPLASAMLLGNRQQLDPLQREQFLLSGTVHLLAISGLHVGILAGFLLFLPRLNLVSRRASLLITVVFVLVYAWVVGFRPPVVRAAILISVFCYCRWAGRRPFSLNSLALAALVVLAINPSELFSVGAQLSFLAVGSIIFARHWLVRPPGEDPVDRLIRNSYSLRERLLHHLAGRLGLAFAISALIWLLALPMVAHTFHVVAPVALLANPLLLIPVSCGLLFGMGVLVFGGWAPPVALLMAEGCQWSLWTIQTTVNACQSVPGGHWWTCGPSLPAILVFYLVLLVVFLRCEGMRFRVFAAGVLVWLVVGWFLPDWYSQRVSRARTGFACTMLDVGHGGCVLLELPAGKNVLYDCGSLGSPRNAQRTAAAVLWHQRIRHLDAVVISHADSDHFNGLPHLAHQFSIGRIVISQCMLDQARTSPMVRALLEEPALAGIPVETVCRGDRLVLGEAVGIEVLNPPCREITGSDNAASIVLDIDFRDKQVLLPGDLEHHGLDHLLQRTRRRYDVVLAPHHGSKNSRPADFLRWSQPRYVVVSSGPGKNTDLEACLPDPRRTEVFHTARDGAVRFEFAADPVTVRRWRHEPW